MKTFLSLLGVGILSLFHQLPTILLWGTILYAVWCTNAPPSFGPLPPNTKILQQSDTHEGFFRTKGTYVLVAKIPPAYINRFAEQLIGRGFYSSPGGLGDRTRECFKDIQNIEPLLSSPNVLIFHRDETIAFIDELWSDYSDAAFDLYSGLLCCVEFDS